jgi:hypothetical protein
MHRRTITSFAALVTVALAIGGTGGAASAAIAHHPVPTGGKTVTATKLPAPGRSAAKINGSAPGKSQELNNLCQQYAGLIDEALDGQDRDEFNGDAQGAAEWHDLATPIVNGGKSQGCQFAWSA